MGARGIIFKCLILFYLRALPSARERWWRCADDARRMFSDGRSLAEKADLYREQIDDDRQLILASAPNFIDSQGVPHILVFIYSFQ